MYWQYRDIVQVFSLHRACKRYNLVDNRPRSNVVRWQPRCINQHIFTTDVFLPVLELLNSELTKHKMLGLHLIDVFVSVEVFAIHLFRTGSFIDVWNSFPTDFLINVMLQRVRSTSLDLFRKSRFFLQFVTSTSLHNFLYFYILVEDYLVISDLL